MREILKILALIVVMVLTPWRPRLAQSGSVGNFHRIVHVGPWLRWRSRRAASLKNGQYLTKSTRLRECR